MKVGLVAMSGIRVVNQELLEAGLSLPGFVERGRVIASLPSLALLTLAGATPQGIELEYLEVDDLAAGMAQLPPLECDLVAISTYSARVKDAYSLADRYRDQGITVVMGGPHVSVLPQEALQHCDCVVIGEGEVTWTELLRDFQTHSLSPTYQPAGREFDLGDAPMPRFELLRPDRYTRLTVQTQRGCPWKCEFCAASIVLTPKYKLKPVGKVVDEIRRIKEIWRTPVIELADDNTFVNKTHGKLLVRALAGLDIRWFTETDVSVAEDAELLRLMRDSGCSGVLIGFESPTSEGLGGVELVRDWKRKQVDRYKQAIETIQSHGIPVIGCFVLGLDGEGEGMFDAVWRFVRESGLYEVQLTVMTAFPGTPLYRRLLQENRLISPTAWERCTLFDVNFVPQKLAVAELERGLNELARRLGDPEALRDRRNAFKDFLRRSRAWRRSGREHGDGSLHAL